MTSSQDILLRLNIKYPIIQAPMAGVSTPTLAAAVSEAGGLGSLGLGAMTAEQAAEQIRQTRQLTGRPFHVNLFCHPHATADPDREAAWLAHLAEHFQQLGASPLTSLRELYQTSLNNDALLTLLLKERPAVVSFHFGLPVAGWIEALRQAGITTMACATSLSEAEQIERAGIDIVIAQGYEAGGHRGVFHPATDEKMGTFALVRLLACRSRLPVVAAGGIMDGDGIAAALHLGAVAVQMGTAFVLCPESAASEAYRRDLQSERAYHTAVTSAISGRPARGIVNRMYALEEGPPIPDYPIAYDAGKALHQAASAQGSSDYAAHWAGQGAPLAREMPAAALVRQLVQEWQHGSQER